MPVIPAPHEHLQNGLDAAAEHIAHHRARIEAHKAEIEALTILRTDYARTLNALGYTAILNEDAPDHVDGTERGDDPYGTFHEILTAQTNRVV